MNLGIFSYWDNRGGGTIARDWCNLFQDKYDIFVYAKDFKGQQDNVTGDDQMGLVEWVKNNKIEKLLVHQFLEHYDEYKKLKEMGTELIVLPMVEYISRDNKDSLNLFDKILCPCKFTCDVIDMLNKERFISNTNFHHVFTTSIIEDSLDKSPMFGGNIKVGFELAGGGAYDRKGFESVLLAFYKAHKVRPDLTLRIRTQVTFPQNTSPIAQNVLRLFDGGVEVHIGDLSWEKNIEQRIKSHVGISATAFTGLDLIPHECLAAGQPMIYMNCAPINEVVTEETGYKYPTAYEQKMGDNYIYKYFPNINDMVDILQNLTMDDIVAKSEKCKPHIKERRKKNIKAMLRHV